MPKDFATNFIKDIQNLLKKDLEEKSERLARNMVGKVQNSIKENVYSVYPNPNIYERTHNLERSISKEIISDTDKITISIFSDDSIAQSHHMNDPNQPLEPYAENVELGIYDFDYPYPPYTYNQPRPFMGKTFEENEQFLINEINKVIDNFTKK